MAISKNTKNTRISSSAAYKPGSSVESAYKRMNVFSNYLPAYSDSYSKQLSDIYSKIKNSREFSYNPENDAAYRRFADEYNALGALAAASNQQQAQELTGGAGSTYAPEVSSQGLSQLKEEAENAIPSFLKNAEEAYAANEDAYKSIYEAASNAKKSELEDYGALAAAYNKYNDQLQKEYSDAQSSDYSQYNANRDFLNAQHQNELEAENDEKKLELKKYDVYTELAENKCADFKEKQNNKGMKSYLDKMVKEGKLTRYLADELYRRYKYEAPAVRSSSGGRRSSGGRYSAKGNSKNEKFDAFADWTPDDNIIKFINLNNRADKYTTAIEWVDYLVDNGNIEKFNRKRYIEYFKDVYKNK